ncbi:MAG: acyl carrier protein [Armatimonadaceae bacterium]
MSDALGERLRGVVASTLGLADDDITDDLSPDNEPAWTSFAHLTLMSAVEEEFGIQLSMQEMSDAKSFGALAGIVGNHA